VNGAANESFALTLAAGVVGTTELANSAVTGAKLSGGQAGSAPVYGARAWALIDGTGTVGLRDSGNMTSVTDLGVGAYRANISTDLSSANCAAVATPSCTSDGTNLQVMTFTGYPPTNQVAPAVGSVSMRVVTRGGGDQADTDYISLVILE
jgi:hypothetical protein